MDLINTHRLENWNFSIIVEVIGHNFVIGSSVVLFQLEIGKLRTRLVELIGLFANGGCQGRLAFLSLDGHRRRFDHGRHSAKAGTSVRWKSESPWSRMLVEISDVSQGERLVHW